MAGERWTRKDAEAVYRGYESGVPVEDMARRLGRSENSIIGYANAHGLCRRPKSSAAEKAKKPTPKSRGEEMLWLHLRALGQQRLWKRQMRFHPTRQWRFDFARPDLKIAVEVDGLRAPWLYKSEKGKKHHPGDHRSVEGVTKGCERAAEAMILGWRILRVTPAQVKSGQAIAWIERLTTQRV